MPKRRPPADAVEAFAANVENAASAAPPPAAAPDAQAPPTADVAPARAPRRRTTSATASKSVGERWPDDLASSLLLRYRDPSLPRMLAQLAELEERSQQQIAHRALKVGLEQMIRDAGA